MADNLTYIFSQIIRSFLWNHILLLHTLAIGRSDFHNGVSRNGHGHVGEVVVP